MTTLNPYTFQDRITSPPDVTNPRMVKTNFGWLHEDWIQQGLTMGAIAWGYKDKGILQVKRFACDNKFRILNEWLDYVKIMNHKLLNPSEDIHDFTPKKKTIDEVINDLPF